MDENNCNRQINVPCNEYIKEKIESSEKLTKADIDALRLEFKKSEQNFPTREQLNAELGLMAKKADEEKLFGAVDKRFEIIVSWVKWLAGGVFTIFIIFLSDYISRR